MIGHDQLAVVIYIISPQ